MVGYNVQLELFVNGRKRFEDVGMQAFQFFMLYYSSFIIMRYRLESQSCRKSLKRRGAA